MYGLYLPVKYQTNHRPMVPPCYVVFSGETTTTINKACKGKGGPSQELVLGFGIGVREFSNIALLPWIQKEPMGLL